VKCPSVWITSKQSERRPSDYARISSLDGVGSAEFLDERGIRPTEIVLAVIYPDDVSQLVAVVVQSRSRMFEILLDYPRGLELSLSMF
jgi:hypothetical protein